MKVGAVLFTVLGVFVLVSGIIYGLWGNGIASKPELAGTFYLAVLGVAFAYMAYALHGAAALEPRDTEDDAPPPERETAAPPVGSAEDLTPQAIAAHASAPALTPFLFALAAAILVVGLVFTHWLVIAGGAGLALVMLAFFLESAPRRAAEHAAAAHAAAALHGDRDGEGHGQSAHPVGASPEANAGEPAPGEGE